MKRALLAGIVFAFSFTAFYLGMTIERINQRAIFLSGPYSDNFEPAIDSLRKAKVKLNDGNIKVEKEIDYAISQIAHCQRWTDNYLKKADK